MTMKMMNVCIMMENFDVGKQGADVKKASF